MPNTVTARDRYTEALVKSVVDFLAADLATAWGGAGVEVVAGSPDLDYDQRKKSDGTMEKRDLAQKPFVVVTPSEVATRPWAMSPRGDEVERSNSLLIEGMAHSHFDVLTLIDTIESIFDGAASSTGGISLKDPDTGAVLGTVFHDPGAVPSATFSGPGDTTGGVGLPAGKAQYENMKHRGMILVAFVRAKVRGSKVI